MLGNLAKRLSELTNKLGRQAKITEDNIQDVVREIRMSLLEADVALSVVKQLTNTVREQAIGQVVRDRLNPGQTFIQILLTELTRTLGGDSEPFNLTRKKPIVILLAGLQGAGKTTTAAKLGVWFKNQKLRALLCSCDVYRPAAIEQLHTLCTQGELDFHPTDASKPVHIAEQALSAAQKGQYDICIVDTAGRSSLDEAMMDEISAIERSIQPSETLLVVDAMTGQDAANTARAFGQSVHLSGVVLSKADSDARGGAALSVASIANCPIRFLGVGEKTKALEAFYPERMAKRILGMGDVLSAIEEAQALTDQESMQQLEHKLRTGSGGFTLTDYKSQLEQMHKIGGVSNLLGKLPGMSGSFDNEAVDNFAAAQTKSHIALINSMTQRERLHPDSINASRKRRIVQGSGCPPIELNRLLKQFKQMSKMMNKMKGKGGMRKVMQQMKAMTTAPKPGHRPF